MISKLVRILIVGLLMATVFPVGSDSIQNTDEQANGDLEHVYYVMNDPIPIQLPEESKGTQQLLLLILLLNLAGKIMMALI